MRDSSAYRKIVLVVLVVAILGVLAFSTVAVGLYGSRIMKASGNGGNGTSTVTQQITISQALQTFKNYLVSLHNPNLVLHEVEEYQYNFYASYYENDTGVFAFQMLIWKPGSSYMMGMMGMMGSGAVAGAAVPEMGPNMMWNTKYGMMSGGMMGGGMMDGQTSGASAPMTVTTVQAKTIAQQYLDNSLPGKAAGDVDTFYGYYTIDVLLNGSTFGMLSVNGYTGQVWYHTWHGAYIQTITVS